MKYEIYKKTPLDLKELNILYMMTQALSMVNMYIIIKMITELTRHGIHQMELVINGQKSLMITPHTVIIKKLLKIIITQ